MSRLKIGSVTLATGEYGTRWIQSSTVSQAPDTAPPMSRAMNSAIPPRTQPARGVRSGKSAPSKTSVGPVGVAAVSIAAAVPVAAERRASARVAGPRPGRPR